MDALRAGTARLRRSLSVSNQCRYEVIASPQIPCFPDEINTSSENKVMGRIRLLIGTKRPNANWPHRNFENLDLRFPTQIVCANREAHACELAATSCIQILGVVPAFIHALLNLSITASTPFSTPLLEPLLEPLHPIPSRHSCPSPRHCGKSPRLYGSYYRLMVPL